MPWFRSPIVTAASPVRTPARAAISGPSVVTASTSSSPARTARSASSSRATGAPHTAMTASPMNFSIVPPYRPITSEARSKYRVRSSRTSSASRPSENVVNPTRSTNSTLTSRRSATGADTSPDVEYSMGVSATPTRPSAGLGRRRVAQFVQNSALGGLTVPQVGQPGASGFPQCMQNRASVRFSVPHLEQVTPLDSATMGSRGSIASASVADLDPASRNPLQRPWDARETPGRWLCRGCGPTSARLVDRGGGHMTTMTPTMTRTISDQELLALERSYWDALKERDFRTDRSPDGRGLHGRRRQRRRGRRPALDPEADRVGPVHDQGLPHRPADGPGQPALRRHGRDRVRRSRGPRGRRQARQARCLRHVGLEADPRTAGRASCTRSRSRATPSVETGCRAEATASPSHGQRARTRRAHLRVGPPLDVRRPMRRASIRRATPSAASSPSGTRSPARSP